VVEEEDGVVVGCGAGEKQAVETVEDSTVAGNDGPEVLNVEFAL